MKIRYGEKRNEQLLPIGNLKGGYEIVSSNFDGNDLVINIVSTRDEKDEVTFAFPDVLAYRNTLECYRLSDVDVNVSKGEIISALYEVKNSNYLDWIANAGYRLIYGEPTDLRHLLIYLDDYVWDVIIHSNNGEVYYIRDGVKTTL